MAERLRAIERIAASAAAWRGCFCLAPVFAAWPAHIAAFGGAGRVAAAVKAGGVGGFLGQVFGPAWPVMDWPAVRASLADPVLVAAWGEYGDRIKVAGVRVNDGAMIATPWGRGIASPGDIVAGWSVNPLPAMGGG